MRAFVVLGLVFSIPSQDTGLVKRLRNDLFCVERVHETRTSSGTARMLENPLRKTTNTLRAPHRSAAVAQSNAVSPTPRTTTLPCSRGRRPDLQTHIPAYTHGIVSTIFARGQRRCGLVAQSNDMIRYDTRCYFNVRSKADISQLNLPHGTDN